MDEHFLRVSRTARYMTLGAPGPELAELWLVCHGYGQLAARFIRDFAGLDDGTRMIVAPEGLSRFYIDRAQNRVMGASWMTREDRLHEIEDYLSYLDALFAEVTRRVGRDLPVTALGFSQGVATATRWAARAPGRVGHLVVWAGTLPPEVDLTVFRDARVTVVCGDQDELITAKVRETELLKLRAAGVEPSVKLFPGGHEVLPEVVSGLARS